MSPILIASGAAWLIAQSSKVVIAVFRTRTVEFRLFTATGGMPSSHSALVAALTTAVGLHEGPASSLFAIALVFSLVVFYDATGVRRATGEQAEVLNQIVHDLYTAGEFRTERLRELLGHTPVEVFVGIALGAAVAWVVWRLYGGG